MFSCPVRKSRLDSPEVDVRKGLFRIPLYISAPAVLGLAGALGWISYAYTGPYFYESCTNERNLLTGRFEASNCGEGAEVAKAKRRAASATVSPETVRGTPGAGADPTPQTGAPSSAQPTSAPPQGSPSALQAGVVASGTFKDGAPGHTGSGIAEIQRLQDGSLNLFLKQFAATNGPDLFVYLSRDPDPGNASLGEDALNLGRLQANNGNQNYRIPPDTDLSAYRSVVIWCRQFSVNFAFATLGGQP